HVRPKQVFTLVRNTHLGARFDLTSRVQVDRSPPFVSAARLVTAHYGAGLAVRVTHRSDEETVVGRLDRALHPSHSANRKAFTRLRHRRRSPRWRYAPVHLELP